MIKKRPRKPIEKEVYVTFIEFYLNNRPVGGDYILENPTLQDRLELVKELKIKKYDSYGFPFSGKTHKIIKEGKDDNTSKD